MGRFRLSRHARLDLDEIADHLADYSPSAATKTLKTLLERLTLLARQPLLGEVREDLPGCPRCFVSGNYVILYQPAADGIEVARVVHASRDIKSLLKPGAGEDG
jgi:toxin ParE1/3/4